MKSAIFWIKKITENGSYAFWNKLVLAVTINIKYTDLFQYFLIISERFLW